jgi:hypothetical protein
MSVQPAPIENTPCTGIGDLVVRAGFEPAIENAASIKYSVVADAFVPDNFSL